LKSGNRFFVIENVPARVCKETGEQMFSPAIVDHLHELITGKTVPVKIIETSVYDYAV
jgi:hypothetical protein